MLGHWPLTLNSKVTARDNNSGVSDRSILRKKLSVCWKFHALVISVKPLAITDWTSLPLLKLRKSTGPDGFDAEHLRFPGHRCNTLFSMLFTTCIIKLAIGLLLSLNAVVRFLSLFLLIEFLRVLKRKIVSSGSNLILVQIYQYTRLRN